MLNDSTRRSLRTVLDVVPAIAATLLIIVPSLGLSAATVAQVGAILGGLVVLFAKIRNALEDSGVLPALLKAPASEGVHPIPDGDDEIPEADRPQASYPEDPSVPG